MWDKVVVMFLKKKKHYMQMVDLKGLRLIVA